MTRPLALTFAALLIIACAKSEATPTEADAQKEFEQRLQEGPHKLISFKKLDGASREELGIKKYCIEFAAETELTRDVKVGDPGLPAVRTARKGGRTRFTGTVNFIRTENDWKPFLSVTGVTGAITNWSSPSSCTRS